MKGEGARAGRDPPFMFGWGVSAPRPLRMETGTADRGKRGEGEARRGRGEETPEPICGTDEPPSPCHAERGRRGEGVKRAIAFYVTQAALRRSCAMSAQGKTKDCPV